MKDRAEEQKNKSTYKASKNMPKEHFSKLPVSVIKHIKGRANSEGPVVRDPRFDARAGTLNKGMFEKSYSFINEMQNERMDLLREEARKAQKIGDFEAR